MWNWKPEIFGVLCVAIIYASLAPVGITWFNKTHCFYYRHVKAVLDEEEAERRGEEDKSKCARCLDENKCVGWLRKALPDVITAAAVAVHNWDYVSDILYYVYVPKATPTIDDVLLVTIVLPFAFLLIWSLFVGCTTKSLKAEEGRKKWTLLYYLSNITGASDLFVRRYDQKDEEEDD